MTIACPKCGGNQIQSVRMIYEGGVTNSSTSGYGVGYDSNGGTTVVGFQGETINKSALASRYSPPKMNYASEASKWGWTYIGLAALGFLFIFMVSSLKGSTYATMEDNAYDFMTKLGIAVIVITLGLAANKFMTLDKERQKDAAGSAAYQHWMDSVVCHTCGTTFSIGTR